MYIVNPNRVSMEANNFAVIDLTGGEDAGYEVGDIILRTTPDPPRYGSWIRIANGQMLIGVDESNTLFDEASKTGGAADEIIPYHMHSLTAAVTHTGSTTTGYPGHNRSGSKVSGFAAGSARSIVYAGTSGNTVNANYQPFFTCFIYARVA